MKGTGEHTGQIAATSINPLFGVVGPIAGECLMSLMARAAVKNVFPRVRTMVREAGFDIPQPAFLPFTRNLSTEQLSQLLDVDPARIEAMMHPALNHDKPLDKVNWYGTCLPRRLISVDRRFSPASFARSGHIRAVWQVRPITYCPESMEFLQTNCLHCGVEVGWRLCGGFHVCETCGRSTRRGRPGKVEWPLRSKAKDVAELVSPDPEVRSAALQKLPYVFHDWEPGDAFVGAVELGLAFSFPNREQHKAMSKSCGGGDFSKFTVNHLVAGYQAMLEWPISLQNFLPTVISEREGDLHMRLGPFGKYFLYSNTYETAIGSLIREEVRNTLTNKDIIPFGGNTIRAGWMKRSDRLTRNESGKQFDIEPKVVGKLAPNGHAVVRAGVKKGQVFYDPEKLGPSVAIYKSALSAHETTARLGVPAFCIEQLACRELVARIDDHDALIMAGGPLYCEHSVNSFNSLLRGFTASPGKGHLLSTCMERQFHPET